MSSHPPGWEPITDVSNLNYGLNVPYPQRRLEPPNGRVESQEEAGGMAPMEIPQQTHTVNPPRLDGAGHLYQSAIQEEPRSEYNALPAIAYRGDEESQATFSPQSEVYAPQNRHPNPGPSAIHQPILPMDPPATTSDHPRGGNLIESKPGVRSNGEMAADFASYDFGGSQGTEKKPAWTDLKTKAGKERKRLPLACIACRRKKIRCSGENPTCKHCERSRIPCVYKAATKKAAPRTDYMTMLDRRLKRMEERVIKLVPKVAKGKSPVPRSVLKPTPKKIKGKKRAASEAFGTHLDEWAAENAPAHTFKGRKTGEGGLVSEGAQYLPSAEIQHHLSEVFFEYVYGQSYHLLHKPTYMRKLKAGTLPPVLVLAVCAISARFSMHPAVGGEPVYLRGEEWAIPAAEICLKRYDEPNLTVLIVLILLALHEFGTCQGGRSWMLGGMATRMAHALQLHREFDIGTSDKANADLTFTDREIRRRAMWACFLMDRFSSSGTERPMFADEETIKIQLPIKESRFQMDLPGPTERLDGIAVDALPNDMGSSKDNMGVAAYMIRAIALWGRVIKYLNMGGKEKDSFAIWESESQYSSLKKQAVEFIATLPTDMQHTKENLQSHAAERIGNQFIFLHVAINQISLFLHRYAIPTMPGTTNALEMPASFLAEASSAAVEAATTMSGLLDDALDHNAVAPFLSYCAFLSGTVHVWGIFSGKPSLQRLSQKSLGSNVRYLSKTEKYWGMVTFMFQSLKDIYKERADVSHKDSSEDVKKDNSIYQYGDWFDRYPHGLSKIKSESDLSEDTKPIMTDAEPGNAEDLQTADDFYKSVSPPSIKSPHAKKPQRRRSKVKVAPDANPIPATPGSGQIPLEYQQASFDTSNPESHQPPMTPYTPTHPQMPQHFNLPGTHQYSMGQDLAPFTTPANTALLPLLDRSLVYDAYANINNTADVNMLMSQMQGFDAGTANAAAANQALWEDNPSAMSMPQQHHQPHPDPIISHDNQSAASVGLGPYSDIQTSAWFMPFNMDPQGLNSGHSL